MRIGISKVTNRKRRVWWRTVLFSERYEYHPSLDPASRGLHKEKRTVHRGHTTFQQSYWVRHDAPELLEARRKGKSSSPASVTSHTTTAPPPKPPASSGAGGAGGAVLDADVLGEDLREALRRGIDRLNPMERQMILAHLAVRIHENGDAVGHPVMMLSAPGVGKSTLWSAMQKMTDAMSAQNESPFRVHIIDMQSAALNVAEQMGAQAIEDGMVRFMFNADLEERLRYCKRQGKPLILVFDEATKAPHILRTMLNLVTTGIIADRRLGVPFRIVLLGNREDWEREMGQLRSALVPFADRFLYYVTTPQEEREYIRTLSSLGQSEAQSAESERPERESRLGRALLDFDDEAEREADEARRARQAERAELAGAAGELEQMRMKVEQGASARETLREHADLTRLLRLMSSIGLRADLRGLCARTNYRLMSAFVDAMLDGELADMFHNYAYDSNYIPNYGSMDSDRKHMSPRRAMILADQLSILFALGYDLESPEVERFLASNVGRPHISKIHEIVTNALKPRGAESIESILDEVATSDAHHASAVHSRTRVHDAATHEGVFITDSDRAIESGAPHTVAEFKGRAIHTMDDLIDALASEDTPPNAQDYEFTLPLHYYDTNPNKVHIAELDNGSTELHLPGFSSYAAADLTRSKHLLHLAGQHESPASHALHLESVDPRSPLGRAVRSILSHGDPTMVAQRLHDVHTETERSLNRLDALMRQLESNPSDDVVSAISREAHRAAAGMAVLSMFHAPVIDGETGHEILPEEMHDDYREYHATAKQKQREELSRLSGHRAEHIDSILSDPTVNAGPLHASGRGRIRDIAQEHWNTLGNAWQNLSREQRRELLHALHLLSAYTHTGDAPYGTIVERGG